MARYSRTLWGMTLASSGFALVLIGLGTISSGGSKESFGEKPKTSLAAAPIPSVNEARGRARLLHETVRAMLQVVHHEYYREDEKLPIPARTFKKAFRDVSERQKVELRWLAVTGQPMNQDHIAQNDFEKNAVSAIASGADEWELAEGGVYRHAGAIALTSECLKCHVPNRTNTQNRAAALVISMPLETP